MKNKIVLIIAFVIGALVFGGIGVYAGSVAASNITYDNINSHMKDSNNNDVIDVQTALDVLYSRAKNIKTKDNTMVYSYDDSFSNANYIYSDFNDVVSFSGRNYFFGMNGNQKYVCFKKNNLAHCFEKDNLEVSKAYLKSIFSCANCTCSDTSTSISCSDSGATDIRSVELSTYNNTQGISLGYVSGNDTNYFNWLLY